MENKNEIEIQINGVAYVPKSTVPRNTKQSKYVIVRTYSAGVFAGYLQSLKGKEAVVLQARRLWYWEGAASLSQLAQSGTSKPAECRFPEEVDRILLTEVIEVLNVTTRAQKSIAEVPVWKA